MDSAKSLDDIMLSCNAGSIRFRPDWLELLEGGGKYRLSGDPSNTGISSWDLVIFAKQRSHVRIDQCGEDSNYETNIGDSILNSTASSSSRKTERSYRSNMFIFFATSKECWSYSPGSTSIHSRTLDGILALRKNDIGNDVCFVLASAAGFPARAPLAPFGFSSFSF